MRINRDYEELFKILNGYRVKYLVVGAYAVMHYTEPRFTKDIDIWIIPEINDPQNVFDALRKFGAPLKEVKPDDFKDKRMILQIGIPPIRIDIMIDVPGIEFQEAWRNKKKVRYGKTPINILSEKELIKAKETAGRPQDKLDLKRLKKNN